MALTELEVDEIRRALVDAATTAGPARGLLGATAGDVVQRVLPGLRLREHNYVNLRDFVQRQAPELRVIGRHGLDVIYGLVEWPLLDAETFPPVEPREPPQTDSLWRIWASPGARRAVAVAKTEPRARALDANEDPAEDEIRIQPASAEFHRHIGRAFLVTVMDQALRAALQPLLDDPDPRWWQTWTRLLQDRSTTEHRRWHEHRVVSLRTAFERALVEAGVEPANAAAVTQILMQTRSRTPRDPPSAPESPATASGRGPADQEPSGLVAVVQAVVARMGDHELRALNLPVGLVYDMLTARRSRS